MGVNLSCPHGDRYPGSVIFYVNHMSGAGFVEWGLWSEVCLPSQFARSLGGTGWLGSEQARSGPVPGHLRRRGLLQSPSKQWGCSCQPHTFHTGCVLTKIVVLGKMHVF